MRVVLGARALCVIFILFNLSVGCAKPSRDIAQPGITTATELKTAIGEPTHIWTAPQRPAAKLLEYPDGCTFQVEKELVVGASCTPVGDEAVLQYWRHKWIGDKQSFAAIADSANPHGQKRYQLVSEQAGLAVIYDEATDQVVQVVKYEKR